MTHICKTPDCPYTGKPSPDSCACHLTEIACLRALNAELLAALEIVANSGKFSCFDDTAWDQINNAIAKSNS